MSERIRSICRVGLLSALAMVLALVEGLLPAIPLLPPGVKLGLSNIVTMYCLLLLGKREGLWVGLLKSLFVLLLRGTTAFLLSLTGGLLSIAVMSLLLLWRGERLSLFLLSAAGAVAHNLGQLMTASLLLNSSYTLYLWPVLVLSGLAMGVVTGVLLRVTLPALRHTGEMVMGQHGEGKR